MKLTLALTILFFGMIALSSCEKKQPTDTTPPPVTEKPLQIEKIESIKSDPLSVDKAAIMISDGLNDRFLVGLAMFTSVGGYFDVKDFKITSPNKGIVLWPCYNKASENGYPIFFLVAEQVEKFDSIYDPLKNNIPGNNLIMPLEVVKYSSADVDQATVKGEILQTKTVSNVPHYNPIDPAKALKFVRAFEKLMFDHSPVNGISLCKYGQYYFIDNSHYKNFIGATDLEFVQYYMGFAWDKDHSPNFYRPILAGVKRDGSVIDKNSKARNGDPLLQKSVPPPPENY